MTRNERLGRYDRSSNKRISHKPKAISTSERKKKAFPVIKGKNKVLPTIKTVKGVRKRKNNIDLESQEMVCSLVMSYYPNIASIQCQQQNHH